MKDVQTYDISDFFRDAEVRVLNRKSGDHEYVLLVRGVGVEAGRNLTVGISLGHPLYPALAALADYLAAADQRAAQ